MTNDLAPWRSLVQRALHRNRSQIFSRYFQLATIGSDGYPCNRTVVFRGFVPESNSLKIVTDTRSEKFSQLRNHPLAEICWYFAKTREQLRIKGKIELVTDEHPQLNSLREEAWQKLSANAKEQFFWPHPGKVFQEDLPKITDDAQLATPINNFCLLLFHPEKVDHLELRGTPQNRYFYWLDEDNMWLKQRVNP